MERYKKSHSINAAILYIAALMSIYVFAWLLAETSALNWDIIWLLQATQRMLDGGTYTHDFFETNPPLIFFIYVPPVVMHHIMSIDLLLTFRGYIFILASASLLICYFQDLRKTHIN